MEIREPRYKVGDKVYCKQYESSAIITGVSDYSFNKDKYFYNVEWEYDDYLDEIHEDLLEPYVEKNVWDLQDGDECYFINVNGSVLPGPWDGNPLQIGSREIGNVFLTKDEAGTEVERRKIEAEMLRLGGRRKFKFNGNNFSIYYSDGLNVKGINVEFYHSTMHQGSIYFDSKEQLNEVVKTIGLEKIKKYIFGVES